MEMGSAFDHKALPSKLRAKVLEFGCMTKKLAQDDPRRIFHSLKVGFAITLVSLFYYLEPLYGGFGVSSMWAVLTVVVVFEFSVGATLGRGLNRGVATFIAAILGFGAQHLASLSGESGEPIVLALSVFLFVVVVTFIRFFPRIKARYDYGLLIFILTFCMISVSGYRDEEILEMAHKRVTTILVGGFTSVFVCIFIYPVWAGDDLHSQIATNIEKLGTFLEGFRTEYFKISNDENSNIALLQGYRSVLNSKQSEESLANFARWEPGHGRFKFRHPWKQYLKIGSLTRNCAYRIDALNGYLNSENQAQKTPEIRSKIEESCTKLCSESAKALKDIAYALETMTSISSNQHISISKSSAKNLKSLMKTGFHVDMNLLEVAPIASVASLLVVIVFCTEKIAESVAELAVIARFKRLESKKRLGDEKVLRSCIDIDQNDHHAVNVLTMYKNSGGRG